MRYLLFGMKNLNESQIEFGKFSHENLLAIDYCGKDGGIESWYAWDGAYKVLAVWEYKTSGFSNTMMVQPCTPDGKVEKVRCADGKDRYLTLAFSHDDKPNWKKGDVIPHGKKIYDEGMTGKASGNHIHLEVSSGTVLKKHYENGQYRMNNALYPHKVLWVDEKRTKVIHAQSYKKLSVPKLPTAYIIRGCKDKSQVKLLQLALNYVLGTDLKIDGIIKQGGKTEVAVMKFQRMAGMKNINGHYGELTKAKLKEYLV